MDDIELVKSKTNIVELIQEYIPLKKAGVNYRANCPFHEEHTPSFMVSPERGIWHCFGCDKGGDVFKFVMEKDGLDFKEALDLLAAKAGVVLKNIGSKIKDKNERLYEINEKAAQFYNYLLLNHKLGKKALEYLKKRGITEETIKEFGLGYAPQNWEALTNFLQKRKFSLAEMVDSGLCVPSNRGLPAGRQGCYDRFRGRIVFPLVDVRNKVIGFSGRVLDGGEPKYINTPQTAIFDKSKLLFGLNKSKGAVKEKKEAIITEGEMDMLLSFQSGVKNVVASKGTAFTEENVQTLKKITDTISLCFDMDLAGDAAARRGIEMADRAGLNIKVIQLSGVKDPAELCLKDPESWKKVVSEATPIYDYYLESVAKRYNLKLATSKKDIFSELIPVWVKISDQIIKEHYIEKLAALTQVKEEVVREEMEKYSQEVKTTPAISISTHTESVKDEKVQKDRRELLEEYLLSLMFHLPKDYTFIPAFPETIFTKEELRQVYVLLVLFLDSISFKSKSFKISEFVKTLPQELVGVVDRLYLMQIDEKLGEDRAWQKELDLVVAELKRVLIKSSLEKLSLKIKNAQEFGKMDTLNLLNKRFRDLSVKLKSL